MSLIPSRENSVQNSWPPSIKSRDFVGRTRRWVQRYLLAHCPLVEQTKLDIQTLICHSCQIRRIELFADPEQVLDTAQSQRLCATLQRYFLGEPLAYILGRQAFWEAEFLVSPDTLIPRPATESLVAWILQRFPASVTDLRVADLGTGSGAIGLSLAQARPHWQVILTDQSVGALNIAKQNATRLALPQVQFYLGDWCEALPWQAYDLIVSNPPYICEQDPHLAELTAEPYAALVSGAQGLDAIQTIAYSAKNYLSAGGILVLEHGYDQAFAVLTMCQEAGYLNCQSYCDESQTDRFVVANWRK